MASASIDYYNSRANYDKLNPLIRSAYNTTTDYEEYKHKLLAKVETGHRPISAPIVDPIQSIRHDQHVRLVQAEHDYYSEKKTQPFDVPYYAQESTHKHEITTTSKPPMPSASRRSPSPILLTEEHIQHHIHHHHHPVSDNIVRGYEEDFAFCPHQTSTVSTTVGPKSTTQHVHGQIENMWDEFEIENYVEKRRPRRPPSAPTTSSWAGRVTVPEPFCLTNGGKMDHIHRKRCAHEAEAAKIQKEAEEELMLRRSFKATPVPAHVRIPLYKQLQEEKRARREQVRHMAKEYLASVSKPFEFESRDMTKTMARRHSYSDELSARKEAHFKAKPLPDFYYRTSKDVEQMKEDSLYRLIKREVRAKELLRQSRLPTSMQEHDERRKRISRSLSAEDLAHYGLDECTFKPRTNGHNIPDYDRLHANFLRQSEEAKRMRPPTKCKPFVLQTNMIHTSKERILEDIRNDEEARHLQSFQIKGKQLPIKSASGAILSASLQQPEAIPTKKTDVQRVREAIGKKTRRDHEIRNKFEEKFQRSRSAKERRLRENIVERAKQHDKSAMYKVKKEEHTRKIRQSIHDVEDDYTKRLDAINSRVRRRPLLLEQDESSKYTRDLERQIQHAMSVAKISEKDLMRQRFNPPDVKVTRTHTNYSS